VVGFPLGFGCNFGCKKVGVSKHLKRNDNSRKASKNPIKQDVWSDFAWCAVMPDYAGGKAFQAEYEGSIPFTRSSTHF
jgi:hypothetical protein